MVEIEGILNSKPLGYVSSDIADPDPITPNLLLMGRYDASLPLSKSPPSIPARMAIVGLLMSRTGHTRGPLPTLFLSQTYLILRKL